MGRELFCRIHTNVKNMNFTFKSNCWLKGLLFLVMAVAVSSVYSDTSATADSPLLSLIRKNYGPGASLSAKFTLTIYWNVREKEEKKKGRILLAPGDRFRVTIDKETFVSDGKTYWQYSAGTNQVVIRNLADVDRSTLPSHIFDRYIAAYPFREAGQNRGVVRFSWKSDSGKTQYREIAIDVQEKGGRITRCVLTDNNGNLFTYAFYSTAFAERLAQERFSFDAPKKTRIVDMRK